MEKNYAICASCTTVAEFKKLIADLPDDYSITWGGAPEFYINVTPWNYTVTLDEDNFIDEE